jgi:hypothetical protein
MKVQRTPKTDHQKRLEKLIADINPMGLVIGTDREYEDEAAMFLERVNLSMDSDTLLEVMRQVFREMFTAAEVEASSSRFEEIIGQYLKLIK